MRFLQFAKSAQGTNITHLRHTFIRTLCLSLVFLSLSIPAHALSLISDEETESWLYDVLTPQPAAEDAKPEKKTWWKKLLG